jgi:putative ABC transport system permease protein
MYDIPVVAGRAYDRERDMYNPDTRSYGEQSPAGGVPMIVNRAAIRALGFDNADEAIEQIVYRLMETNSEQGLVEFAVRIIGVVEDNMYMSLHRRPAPEIYMLVDAPNTSMLMFKYEDAVEASIQETVRTAIQDATGSLPAGMFFTETRLDSAFQQERNESLLLLICGALALLLASIGLYGMASFSMERNVKEVGVRKVLGSTVASIMTLFVWRFSRPVLLANLLAWPVAAYFVLEWIKQFPYQLEKIWLLPLCVGAALLVLLIAILTVSVITAKAAAAKPVESLRYE